VIVERVRREERLGSAQRRDEQFEDLVKAESSTLRKYRARRCRIAAQSPPMLTTEALVSEIPEEKRAPAMPVAEGEF